MKKIFWIFMVCVSMQTLHAQTPKWAENARKAIFSIITYDKNDKIKSTGNGFYIDKAGIALSDYSLFDGAERATVINGDGTQKEVLHILGANTLYDVIKFDTQADKKQSFLPIATTPAKEGDLVFLMPYSTQKSSTMQSGRILQVDSIGNNSFYYTIEMKTTDKTISCPIMNSNGEVLGMIQKNASEDSKESYAIGASFGASLVINAITATQTNLNSIGIKKGLPDTEEDALVYLFYVESTEMTREAHLEILNDFIEKFPNNSDGYLRRAIFYMSSNNEEESQLAEKDFEKSIKMTEDNEKDWVYYQVSNAIYNYVLSQDEKDDESKWTYERALKNIKTALEAGEKPLYVKLEGDIHFAMHNYADALNCYEKVNQSELASASTFYSAAKTKHLMEGSDIGEVIALMDSAIATFHKPYIQEAAPYFYERAALHVEAKKYREAVSDYNTFHDIVDGNVNALFYYQREQAEMQCRMYQQAINDINRAVEMEPNDIDYWLEKGTIHLRVNQHDEAEKAFRKAVEIDGQSGTAYRMLGYCFALQKKTDEACSYLQKAKELGDNVVDTLIEKYCK